MLLEILVLCFNGELIWSIHWYIFKWKPC